MKPTDFHAQIPVFTETYITGILIYSKILSQKFIK
jgi:hypothetical protein